MVWQKNWYTLAGSVPSDGVQIGAVLAPHGFAKSHQKRALSWRWGADPFERGLAINVLTLN